MDSWEIVGNEREIAEMGRRYRPGTQINPRRGEIWLAVDKNKKHNGNINEREYHNHEQGGTRTCVIVSNNTGNVYSPNVEIVYTTTKDKADLPTHFMAESTPELSTVLCEGVDTISKRNLVKCYGELDTAEMEKLNECLRISLGL